MPDMHSSIYSIMQDNLKSELKYYPVLGFSDAGFFSKKTLGLCHKPHKTVISQNFALQSGYAAASYSELCFAKRSATAASFFAVHWSKHFATQNGLLSKFCYAKPPIQNFASQSGLRPPHHGQSILLRKTVCDRPVFFGVHTCAVSIRNSKSFLPHK